MPAFPFRAVLFDLDGTLADTSPDLAAALNHALGELGRPPVTTAAVRTMVGQGARALLAHGLAASGSAEPALVDRGLPLLLGFYEAHIADESRPFPGAAEALDALAGQGVALAVCTNKVERLARRFLQAIGWADRFVAVVGGDSAGAAKPDPAPVNLAVRLAGGGPAAFVGDSSNDTRAARAAGLPCVALTFGFPDRPPAELGADRLIDHWADLVPALAGLG